MQKHQDEFCQKYKCESVFPLPELLEKHALVHGKHGIERYVQIFNEHSTYNCLTCGNGFKEEFFVFIHCKKIMKSAYNSNSKKSTMYILLFEIWITK